MLLIEVVDSKIILYRGIQLDVPVKNNKLDLLVLDQLRFNSVPSSPRGVVYATPSFKEAASYATSGIMKTKSSLFCIPIVLKILVPLSQVGIDEEFLEGDMFDIWNALGPKYAKYPNNPLEQHDQPEHYNLPVTQTSIRMLRDPEIVMHYYKMANETSDYMPMKIYNGGGTLVGLYVMKPGKQYYLIDSMDELKQFVQQCYENKQFRNLKPQD